MNVGLSLARPWIWLLHQTISLWVRTTVQPPEIAQRLAQRERPTCYVLEWQSLADLLVLQDTCVSLGLPRPSRRLVLGEVSERRSVCSLERNANWFGTRIDRRPPELLAQRGRRGECRSHARPRHRAGRDLLGARATEGRLAGCACSSPRTGRSPDACASFFTVLINGRYVVIAVRRSQCAREPHRSRGSSPRAAVRRASRVLRSHFRTQRATTIGPDLSHRRTIVAQVLAHARGARSRRAGDAREEADTRREALLHAKRYADEIAANYSHAFVYVCWRACWPRVEPPLRRRGRAASRARAAPSGDGQRDRLRALSPQPHGLSAAVLRDLPERVRRAARRRRRQPQSAGHRAVPAQGRGVLHAPLASAARVSTRSSS